MKGVLIAVLLGSLAGPASAAAPVKIVVLPIVVHSADPDTRYVSDGLSDMLASRLEQTGSIAVERVDDPGAATSQLGEALRRGRAVGGNYALFGSFTQFGDGASLDIQCIPLDVESEAEATATRRIFVHAGTMGAIIPKLDEIVDRVTAYVHVERVHETPAGVAESGAESPAAPVAGSDADVLRDLSERLEALEQAVFGGEASAATAAGESKPES